MTSTVFIHLLTIPCSHHVRFQRGFECTDKFYGFCKEITHFLLIYVHSNIILCFVAIGKSKRQVRKKASTLRQQATIEMTRRDHSFIACSHHKSMGVILRAHSVRGESHIKCHTNQEKHSSEILSRTSTFRVYS